MADLELKKGAAPDTPDADHIRLHATAAGNIAAKDSAGVVHVYGYEFSLPIMLENIYSGYKTPPIEMPYAGTIVSVRVTSNSLCTLQADIWKGVYNSLPLGSNLSIVAAAPVTLAGAVKNEDTTLVGWTKTLAQGEWVQVVINTVTAGSSHSINIRGGRT